MQTLANKTAVVTGGGSGIGRAIALALAEAGTHVVVADIQQATAVDVADEAREHGVRALGVGCDVADRDAVMALADQSFAAFGRVDILCNNAGITWRPYRSLLDSTLDEMQRMFAINFWGVVHGMHAFVPRMRSQSGEKHIVNTSSIVGVLPTPGHATYVASKAAVAALSEAAAGELAPHGFGMTILCPANVPTGIAANSTRVLGEVDAARRFEPVAMPLMDRLRLIALPSPEPVGAMVRDAILANTLYLHTGAVPCDMVAERVHAQFGAQTIGTAVTRS